MVPEGAQKTDLALLWGRGQMLGPGGARCGCGRGRGGLTSVAGGEGSPGWGCVTGAPELQPRALDRTSRSSIRDTGLAAMKPARGEHLGGGRPRSAPARAPKPGSSRRGRGPRSQSARAPRGLLGAVVLSPRPAPCLRRASFLGQASTPGQHSSSFRPAFSGPELRTCCDWWKAL